MQASERIELRISLLIIMMDENSKEVESTEGSQISVTSAKIYPIRIDIPTVRYPYSRNNTVYISYGRKRGTETRHRNYR
jgi:hypothetical protein